MATDGPTPKPCDHEIYINGEVLAMAVGPSNAIENFVKQVAAQAKARMDWHYAGGRGIIKFLGDAEARSRAIVALHTMEPGGVQDLLINGE